MSARAASIERLSWMRYAMPVGQLTAHACQFFASLADKVASVRIDMIEGKIGNPLQIVDNLRRLAASSGAETLNISGTLANPRLLDVLAKRYGAVSQGANEVISISPKGGGG